MGKFIIFGVLSLLIIFISWRTLFNTENGKVKKEKKPVGETMRVSLAMYNQRMSIAEIATSRNLSQSTIISHLEKYVISGELDINEFISPEKREKAADLIRKGTETGSFFEMLSAFLNYTEVKMFMAWLRSAKK